MWGLLGGGWSGGGNEIFLGAIRRELSPAVRDKRVLRDLSRCGGRVEVGVGLLGAAAADHELIDFLGTGACRAQFNRLIAAPRAAFSAPTPCSLFLTYHALACWLLNPHPFYPSDPSSPPDPDFYSAGSYTQDISLSAIYGRLNLLRRPTPRHPPAPPSAYSI